ncbi:Sulfite exporter TauE/SafE [Methyloligella halotolerans]|uniref:Probable membrane transporter protein n=1 Tax=Methyloligella halotolerans TaxID=1177755 RepID=A0A1E2RXY4_9HYPH|nr:sulfite exporter TauE/SafE family protein [Methyloligella halotolerans]ODA67084.1 Sulfite exporter TauE/SafE [Methyloligella halotolerans]
MSWVVDFLPLVGAGCVVGFLIGLTGVGGGALMTPLLISTFGVSPQIAVGTDLLYASITKCTAGWRHHTLGHVDWPIMLRLAAGSVPAALIVLGLMAFTPLNTEALAEAIRGALVFVLPASALAILVYPRFIKGPLSGEDYDVPVRPLPTIIFGVVLGALVTLTSVGAGAIGVAVLSTLYPLLRARRVVGTDIAHAVPLTLVGGLGHLGLGHVDLTLMVALLVGSIPGMLIGTRLVGLAPEWLLRPVLAIALCYAAYSLFTHAH